MIWQMKFDPSNFKYKLYYNYVQHKGRSLTMWLGSFFNEYIKDYKKDWVPFVEWHRYQAIVNCFFEIMLMDLVKKNRVILLPYSLGHFYIQAKKARIAEKVRRFGVDCLFPDVSSTTGGKWYPKETEMVRFKLVYRSGYMRNVTRLYKFRHKSSASTYIWEHISAKLADPHQTNYKAL